MSKLPGYENTVQCPYNKCHIILKARIQTHLIKCAKQHPEIKLEICPFDVTHRFRAEDMKAHVEECPSRENFDRYVYNVRDDEAKPSSVVQQKARSNHPKDEDDWE